LHMATNGNLRQRLSNWATLIAGGDGYGTSLLEV
jgi:hypothetical protein